MPAPYIGHISPVLQELNERLLRLQIKKAERDFEEGVGEPVTGRAPAGEEIGAVMEKAGAGAYTAALEREKAERAARTAELTTSVVERQQDLAERKQDWEMVKFGIEQRTEQMKAIAPKVVGKEEAVYLPGMREFDIPGLDFPEMYTDEKMAEVIFYDKRTGEQTGSIPKELVKNVEVSEDAFHNKYLFDKNTGDFLGRYLTGWAPLEYEIEMEKATSPMSVALINERAGKSVERIRKLSAAEVAGITAEADIGVATMQAESKLAKILSDEKVAMWGINSAEKIAEAKNMIERGMLVLVEGRLELDREALAALNLNKVQDRNLKKYLEMYQTDILRELKIMGIEVEKEKIAVTRELGLLKAETDAKAVANAEQAAKWEHEDRQDTRRTLQFRAESDRTFKKAQVADWATKNDLYEKSIDNDATVNMLRARAYDRITGAEAKSLLSGITRAEALNEIKVLLEQKEMWGKKELIRIRELEDKLEVLRDEWVGAEGDAKVRLGYLVVKAEKNLMDAQATALANQEKLELEQREYDRERDKIEDAETVRKNETWAKMIREGIGSLNAAERLAIGAPAKTPFTADTVDEALHFYKEKQKILAEWGPYGEGTWEQRKLVIEYELAIETAEDLLTDDQKKDLYTKMAEVNETIFKEKAGIGLMSEKELSDYEARVRAGDFYRVPLPKGEIAFVSKKTFQEEARFDVSGKEQAETKYHYYPDKVSGVMHVYENGVEVSTPSIGKALSRKQKENLFMELWGKAARAAGLEVSGIKTLKDKENVAKIFIAAVEMDPDLLPAEKALAKQWAGMLAGEEVSLSEMIGGKVPVAELPESIPFEEFIRIFNEATAGAGRVPEVPSVTPVPKAPKKVKGASAVEMKRFIDEYWRKHPDASKEDVREAVRKRFGV